MNTPTDNDQIQDNMPNDADSKRLAEAWEWVLRLREDGVGQDDLAAWLRWYEADERNKDAFEDMQSFWRQAERVAEEPNPLAPELWLGELAKPRPSHGQALAARNGHARSHAMSVTRRRRKYAWAGAALAAGLCALLIVPKWLPFSGNAPKTHDVPSLAVVAAPKVQETRLSDGSLIELAPKSQVAVLFSEKQRLLEMNGGEAYFKVAHNRARPFIVKVGDINVRAVGTAFNIRNSAGRVVVTVTEGTVEVYPAKARSADVVRVKAGNEVVWAANAKGPVIASSDTSYATSWKQGRLDYLNEPLSAAVADINRYSKRQVIVGDAAAGDILFSGTVLANDTDTWIRALPTLFPVDLRTDTAGNVVIVSRANADGDRSDQAKAR